MSKKISILSVALVATFSGMIVSPVLGQIKAAFAGASVTYVGLISTMHSIAIIPCLLISGWLANRFSKKGLLLTALLIYAVGGMLGGLAKTIEFILATRLVLGIGVGLLLPINPTLVADFFSGDERASMMGKVSGTNNIGGIIAFTLAGVLAAISWRLPFILYGLALLAFIAVAIWLPKQPPLKKEKKDDGVKIRVPYQVYLLGLSMFGIFAFMYTITTNMAMYIMQNKIAPPAVIGLIMSCATVGAMIAGMIFLRYKRLLRAYIVPVQLLLMSAAFFIIKSAVTPYVLAGGILIFGFGYGMLIPFIYNNVSIFSDKTQMVKSMGTVQILMYFAQFLSPIIFGFVARLFGQTSIKFIYTLDFYVLGAVAVLAFIIVIFKKKPKQEESPVESN